MATKPVVRHANVSVFWRRFIEAFCLTSAIANAIITPVLAADGSLVCIITLAGAIMGFLGWLEWRQRH